MSKGLDILAIGVHPDDVELGCSGTLLSAIKNKKRCGVLHLTKGEMGSRGNPETRIKESRAAAKLMKLDALEQIDLGDCCFEHNKENITEIAKIIRKHRPAIVFCNSSSDRHPDHGRAAKLVADACYYSGLLKLVIPKGKGILEAFRPNVVFHYLQDRLHIPDLVVDITPFMDKKLEIIACYKSQFYQAGSKEPETAISGKSFFHLIRSKARVFGREIGVEYGEAFTSARAVGTRDITKLF